MTLIENTKYYFMSNRYGRYVLKNKLRLERLFWGRGGKVTANSLIVAECREAVNLRLSLDGFCGHC